MNWVPESRPTRLADGRVSPPAYIPATIHRGFAPGCLPEVETAWSPGRQELAAAREAVGSYLESGHWDWTGKVDRVERGELWLIAVECEGEVQGLMAIPARPRPSVLTPGQSVVYVDYLETAPWNQRTQGRTSRFGGVGSALITEAIIVSIELGLGGRVGLHSLPQAVRFYHDNCQMTQVGADPAYYDLVYFEYAEGAGPAWLAARNTQ